MSDYMTEFTKLISFKKCYCYIFNVTCIHVVLTLCLRWIGQPASCRLLFIGVLTCMQISSSRSWATLIILRMWEIKDMT